MPQVRRTRPHPRARAARRGLRLHRRPRRGRARAARRAGGRRRRWCSISSACRRGSPIRRRSTAARREALFAEILATAAGRHRLGLARGDRPHQHPAGVAAGHVPGARRLALHARTSPSSTATIRRPCPAASRRSSRAIRSIASIAAASIVAKVVRDRMMARLGELYPAYGFASNVGLLAPNAHLTALASDGPCPFHRLSFSPAAPRVTRTCNRT